MVSGDDKSGDHHVFVSTNKGRAEARHRVMLAELANVKANWLDT